MIKNISILIPCFNEKNGIKNFHSTLLKEIEPISDNQNINFLITYIDDGSNDKTFDELKQLKSRKFDIQIIKLSKNYGKEYAILCGLKKNSDKDSVIVMDCDLQHPPKYISSIVNEWMKGYLLVVGKRKYKRNVSFLRSVGSKIFNLMQFGTSNSFSDFSLIDKKVLLLLNKHFNEKNFIFKNFIQEIGFDDKKKYFFFESPEREVGTSSFNLIKLGKMFLTSLFSYSIWPLKISVFIGLIILISSLLIILFMFFHEVLLDNDIYTLRAYFVVFNTLLSGVTIFTIGICTIYIALVLKETQSRPNFIIEDEIKISKDKTTF